MTSTVLGSQKVLTKQIDSTTGYEAEQNSTSGAGHSRLIASEVAFPEWTSLQMNKTQAATATGTVLYTSTNITDYNYFGLEVAAIGGTTPVINAFPSFDGGTNYAATALGWINLQTGAIISGATGLSAVGIYALIGLVGSGIKMSNLKLTITGGASDLTCTLRGMHGVI